ncbi:uncharacterized protein LOC131167655 [Malania oleifera]|uniref:uncharacterized protein LOC131167655 n=1 Tax=Malania oleifera TaxID=397392 RepID=UPI0025AEA4A1|nr:uncharacterized protein LOC131167655 [Malania oleifera]XP_057982450.1 uncharacterized protein LOC131167655 [Malania oleifera]
MKEIDKKKNPNNNQARRSGRTEKRENKQRQENAGKKLNAKEIDSKTSYAGSDSSVIVSDSKVSTEPPEVYESMVIHYVDDVNRFEEVPHGLKAHEMVGKENNDETNGHSSDLDKEPRQGKGEESDSETTKDSSSSQGDSQIAEDEKLERILKVPKKVSKKGVSESSPHVTKMRSDREAKTQMKVAQNTPKRSTKSNKGPSKMISKDTSDSNFNNMKVPSRPSSESSEGADDKSLEEEKEIHFLDATSNGAQSVVTDDETVNAEENGEHEERPGLDQKIEEMEMRIEKLEEELREVAALEISLYSVVPEHGSSAHKVHTPARRLSRLYIHACKHWTQDKRATIARNTVSGLVLIAKSCGNDVPRLTFWLSNIVVLREIISQTFGNSCYSSPVTGFVESNGSKRRGDEKASTLKWKGVNKLGVMHFADDWQETRTLTAALEKVESWIFSRIVESVWWQTLTPNMQSPVEDLCAKVTVGRFSGPALGDQHQGSFSVDLWKNAFQDAFQRLCPVRAGGHECGCLPILARMVMHQCVARLDVAMFNAILRESAHEIPTDPVSDPIVDSKVLPIPAGCLSFGSGAQLKNSVGNWSRCLTDLFGMEANNSFREDQCSSDDDVAQSESKSFHLLNALSDLLMLPKDMLMDRSIRKEVCPLIGLPLIKRVLCNFTPDEFCPDPVPGAVLEALNAESIVERRLSGGSASSFPYTAAPVIYAVPSCADVAEKVAEAGGEKSHLARNVSIVQKKGYTSDEELEELDSPLAFVVVKMPPFPTTLANGNGKHKEQGGYECTNSRYELLREVWSM